MHASLSDTVRNKSMIESTRASSSVAKNQDTAGPSAQFSRMCRGPSVMLSASTDLSYEYYVLVDVCHAQDAPIKNKEV